LSDVADFIRAACVPLDRSHVSGKLDRAESILAEHPEFATDSIYTTAVLGDDAGVRRFIDADPSAATRKGRPHDWDALTHLCFSRYLRLDPDRSAGFVAAARALLDAGANPNTGWWENSHQPRPEWECALYGAAGVAHHAELTRLLIERGADPNDGEVTYHSPEEYDNGAMQVLVESGKLTPDSLATMLLRKHDWHDYDGIVFLLDHSADPNRLTHWRATPLQHAVRRDNDLQIIKAVLDRGGDINFPLAPMSPLSLAVRRGREDVLEELRQREIPIELRGVERLIAACAIDDVEAVKATSSSEPDLVRDGAGRTPLALAVKACVDSYWSERRSPESVQALLDAGASARDIPLPSGYREIDVLLEAARQ